MAYFYIGLIILFFISIIVIAQVHDKEDMES